MQLTKALILTLSAMVPLTAAAPAAAAIDQNYDTSPANQLLKRDNNHCSPTGRESCNFWLQVSHFGDRWWRLFDFTCREIGGGGSYIEGYGKYSLTSELPYTIELSMPNGAQPSWFFWYAGRRTNLEDMHCVQCKGDTARCCRIAFRCY